MLYWVLKKLQKELLMPIFNFLGLISAEISFWKHRLTEHILKSGKNARFWPKGLWTFRAELWFDIHEFNGTSGLTCDWTSLSRTELSVSTETCLPRGRPATRLLVQSILRRQLEIMLSSNMLFFAPLRMGKDSFYTYMKQRWMNQSYLLFLTNTLRQVKKVSRCTI